jgi:hypothetical protein
MRVTLYIVTAYGIDMEEARSRGMVTTDEDEARGMASALSGMDAEIHQCDVFVPIDLAGWTVYAR